MSGGVYTTDKSKSLGSLSDVSEFDNLADGEVLKYNATTELWENGTAGTPAGTEIFGTDNLRSLTFGTGTPSGTNNILLGASAGEDLTTGTLNTLIGFNAGKEITTGINNVFLGAYAGSNTSTTESNIIGIGTSSAGGGATKAGRNSISIGNSAGNQNASISSVNIGNEAGRFHTTNTDGFDSVNIGNNAGRNQPKQNCVNIGRQAGLFNNSNNAINIGNESGKARSGLSSVNLGHLANQTNVNTHDRAIVINASGVNVPSVAHDTFVVKPIRNATGANALFYDSGSGEITYDTAGGGGTEIVATRNLITSALGAGSSLNATGTDNILLGDGAGASLVSHDGNIMLGYRAGNNTINNNNVAIGYQSAGGNTNLQNSITIGHYAGEGSLNLTSSVVIGDGAGYQMTNAIGSTFLGYSAGRFKRGNFNVAIGYEALRNTTTNNNSVGIGYSAGRNNNGASVVCIGQKAGESNAGNFSVLIGTGAGQVGGNHANTIVLNANASSLNPTQANSCFINPIRAVDLKLGTDLLYYDNATKELQRSSTDITKFFTNFSIATTFTSPQLPIVFTNAPSNVNGGYNTGTGVFTAPVNGYYKFSMFYGLSQGNDITLNWEVNGTIVKSDVKHCPSGGGSGIRTFDTIYEGILGAGDTVEINIASIVGTIHFGTAGEGLRGVYIGK